MSEVLEKTFVDNDGTLVVSRWQDCEAIVEANKEKQKETQRHDCAREIADVPMVFLEQILNEEYKRGHMLRLFSPEYMKILRRRLETDWTFLRCDNKSNPGGLGTAHDHLEL